MEVRKGWHHTAEAKQKMSQARLGTKASPETKLQMSLRRKGYKHSEETKAKIAKAHIGYRHSDETRRKMSQTCMGRPSSRKGVRMSEETKRKLSNAHKGLKWDAEAKARMAIRNKGASNPNWRGGIQPIRKSIRNSEMYATWRLQVYIRDNSTCKKCGATKILHAHHIKPFAVLLKEVRRYLPLFPLEEAAYLYPPLWDIANGITLCEKCHKQLHRQLKEKNRG